jgi:hypothetical protein
LNPTLSFRRFLRGLNKVQTEWKLLCANAILLKLRIDPLAPGDKKRTSDLHSMDNQRITRSLFATGEGMQSLYAAVRSRPACAHPSGAGWPLPERNSWAAQVSV